MQDGAIHNEAYRGFSSGDHDTAWRTCGAQQSGKMFCIGILSPAKQPSTKVFEAFREGLRALGYIEGGNITIEYRLAAGDNRQLPVFAGELARLPVDIIVARIFDSASPGDLPIDEPTHFEFVVNLKTAQALGLTIPPSVLDRADKIIE